MRRAFFKSACGSGKTHSVALILANLLLSKKCEKVIVRYVDSSSMEIDY